jgi:hypothetical protein
MKNNLLEINFLKNIIEQCNLRISELYEEIKNDNSDNNVKTIILKQQISTFIKKRESAKKTFAKLLLIK